MSTKNLRYAIKNMSSAQNSITSKLKKKKKILTQESQGYLQKISKHTKYSHITSTITACGHRTQCCD